MCGRFALPTPENLATHFNLRTCPEIEPRYNIAPSQDIAAVRLMADSANRELVLLKWGLVPFWAKDKKIGYKMINARAESVGNKPSFRAAFRHRRCLIPAGGFFEWDHSAPAKQPYYIRRNDSELLAFAGLWEHWQGQDDEIIESCTILTTEANTLVGKIHDRMPVIIEPIQYAGWLDPQTNSGTLLSMLKPLPDWKMLVYPVGKAVNNPKNDNPLCLTANKDN